MRSITEGSFKIWRLISVTLWMLSIWQLFDLGGEIAKNIEQQFQLKALTHADVLQYNFYNSVLEVLVLVKMLVRFVEIGMFTN